jgi:molecular chaperone DnaK
MKKRYLIRKKTKELDDLLDNIYYKQDERFVDYFYHFRFLEENEYSDISRFRKLIELGEKALENRNLIELKSVCNQLWNLLKVKPKEKDDFNNFDGNLGLK